MPIDVCASQCRMGARSKYRHPELKITFLKQLVNSDHQSFFFIIYFNPFFFLFCSKRQDHAHCFWQRVIPDGTVCDNPADTSWEKHLLESTVHTHWCYQKSTDLQIYKREKKNSNSLLHRASSLAQRRQNRSSKVPHKHED